MAEINENVAGQNSDSKGGRSDRYIFNVSFAAYFVIILLLALLRIIISLGASSGAFDWAGDDGADLIFTFIAQIIILGLCSVIVISCFFKKGFKGTLDYLQVKKPKPYIFLAFAIGFFGYFVNMVINMISSLILVSLGWHAASGGTSSAYPIWMFFVSVLFTAIFPGICEEIAHRGLVLRAMQKGGASDTKTIVVTGLFFGLFHMFLGQTAFTFVMGCVMAFLTVKSKSIVPAVIMHFTNNFMAVCIDFFGLMNPLLNSIDSGDFAPLVLFVLFCIASIAVFFMLLTLFLKRARKAGDCPPKKMAAYQAPYMQHAGSPFGYGSSPFAYMQPPAPQQQYIKPQSQPESAGLPVRPENQGGPVAGAGYQQNPYAAPQPFNPYDYKASFNLYTPPANNPYYPQAVQPPPNAAADTPAPKTVFKASLKDKAFYYATMLLAGMITIISFISGM